MNGNLEKAKRKLSEAEKVLGELQNERKYIAGKIANNLNNSGVEVDIDPNTGNISLRMDESFYFTTDSAELKASAKQKLGKIIPVYANTLLSDPQIAERIDKIAITGYASPRYKSQPMDPLVYNKEAYNYNLELSMDRSRTITEYIFGEDIPNYKFKDRLRTLVNVSGQGYMNAVPLTNPSICKVSSRNKSCGCGRFDCFKSRRVEIQFILKDQNSSRGGFKALAEKLKEKKEGDQNVGH